MDHYEKPQNGLPRTPSPLPPTATLHRTNIVNDGINMDTAADQEVVSFIKKMAEKEKEEGKAGTNNDDDDLDALLDSALEDFDKSSSACKNTSKPCAGESLSSNGSKKTKDSSSKDPKGFTMDEFGLSEKDLEVAAAEFEKSMRAMLGDNEELLKQWNEFTEEAAGYKPEDDKGGCEPTPEDVEAFEAHLLKTMKDVAENAKEMTNSAEFDESFFKAMADMNMDGKEPDFSQGIFPMMQGMMMNLLSKDVLYPALDDLRTKYPPWLEEKKSTLKSDVYENYSQQYKLVCEICSEYEKESERDSEDTKKKRFNKLMGLVQKMQQYGQPPQELVGDRVPDSGVEGGFPPNKCPMM